MTILGYYYDKIGELEKSTDLYRTPVCFACQTMINEIFYRIRYLENQNHEIFKIFFHYFPPCFSFDHYYGVKNCSIIADGYEVQTKYLAKHPELGRQLVKLDRIILGIDPNTIQGFISNAYIRTEKNAVTTMIRDELVHKTTE